MRIGLTLRTYPGHNLWDDGAAQSSYHLAASLAGLPCVERVVLLACGTVSTAPLGAAVAGTRCAVVPLAQAAGHLDLVIDMDGVLEHAWHEQLRAGGAHIVLHVSGSLHAALAEQDLFGAPARGERARAYDEVWITAGNRASAVLARGLYRAAVHELPYLWSPRFLEASAAQAAGATFGYRAGSLRGGVRAAILEPNLSPRKMGTLPLLICEEVERSTPGAIRQVQLYNGAKLLGNPTFAHLVSGSDLHRRGKLDIYHRDYVAHVLAGRANMVVSHQLDAPLNHLFLDALAGAYPLVHNSPLLSGAGYYYPFCDIDAGKAAVLQALGEHDRDLAAYRRRARALITAVSPDRPANRHAYACRLQQLLPLARQRRAA